MVSKKDERTTEPKDIGAGHYFYGVIGENDGKEVGFITASYGASEVQARQICLDSNPPTFRLEKMVWLGVFQWFIDVRTVYETLEALERDIEQREGACNTEFLKELRPFLIKNRPRKDELKRRQEEFFKSLGKVAGE